MNNIDSTYEYQVGGSLDSDSPSYVTREADSVFYRALKAGQFCYVLNSRQMGKSSLRVQTMRRLQNEGTVCILIDLTEIGRQDMTPEKWYGGIVQYLVSGCQLTSKTQWRNWWRERRDLLSPAQRLSLFIKEVILVQVKQNIVIFIDEIDRVLSQNFCLDDFFGLIRCFYDQRDTSQDYKRLNFAVLGVASPTNLIQDKTQTPFNIGQEIQLRGFQAKEVKPLLNGLSGQIKYPQEVLQNILSWTGGQPFLTQKLCQLVINSVNRDEINSSGASKFIEQLVNSYIVENWEARDVPEHLRTIQDRILRNEANVVQLLGLYHKILRLGEIDADSSTEQIALLLSGLVLEEQGKLKIYNPIYKAIFDHNWVENKLNKIRPYALKISSWIVSGGQDKSSLLRGAELQNVLTWALGKTLSDRDYQFLVASQELAKQNTLKLLEANEHASYLLASARSRAKRKVREKRLRSHWIPLSALSVTVFILVIRLLGVLQGLELNALDRFFLWRSPERSEERIAIVTIDETDLQSIGQWPIPDGILAQSITSIKAQNPHSIGLDIYRDLTVEPGHTDLVTLFQSTPNIFGIEKVVEPRIAPSPILSQLRQVGFSDLVVDKDGKIRRALLSVILSESEVRYSLAARLGLYYLESKGINLEPYGSEKQRVRLGKAVFKRFSGNDGGYIRASSGGYQILLNYRGTQKEFLTFSLQDVLDNKIPPESFRDRIVLIGTTAKSIKDLFYTPYSSRTFDSPDMMPGVIVHANIISQMLSASIDGRPLLKSWSEPMEWFGILAVASIGAVISWWVKSTYKVSIIIVVLSGILAGGCYLAFLSGWWLPLVPFFLALYGTTITVLVVTNKQQDKLQLQITLDLLLKVYQDSPEIGRIAIEYLKHSENSENKAYIEKKLT